MLIIKRLPCEIIRKSDMEASRRERIMLYGVVPIVAAIVGAVATVTIGRYVGGDHPSEVMVQILKTPGLTPADKAKLMSLANESTDKFYNFLESILGIVSALVGFTGVAIGQRIARR